jgi:hypothetical protein
MAAPTRRTSGSASACPRRTKPFEVHRYRTTSGRAANRRLFRLVAEVLHAIEAGVFHPNPGWACKDCPFRSHCWAWG